MDQESSELHTRNWRQGEVLRDAGIKVFQIETTVNNDLYGDGPMKVLAKREWEWTPKDRAAFMAARAGLDSPSRPGALKATTTGLAPAQGRSPPFWGLPRAVE